MLRGIILFCLVLGSNPVLAAGSQAQQLTWTTQVLDLTVMKADILASKKQGYGHVLWDAFPLREELKAKPVSLSAAAQALALGPGLAKMPEATRFKIDIVEFPERDDYGAPRWESIKVLGKFEVSKAGKAWLVKDSRAGK
jgi:hypothetical protein